jgi:glycosyltransferase involved in cell wall biosynthesis
LRRSEERLDILLLEPYLTGSHAAWAEEYAARSRHRIHILGLPGRHWKWRMHGGAATLARRFFEEKHRPDLLLATDMLDLTTFLALTRSGTATLPTALYFHENQLTYPWSPTDADPKRQRDVHYGYINYGSALAADAVLYNSDYHRSAFLGALGGFLGTFPDYNETGSIEQIAAKSRTLSLGLDLQQLDTWRPAVQPRCGRPPLLLWNHRWEYDKNPEEFFRALFQLAEMGVEFELVVLGEGFRRQPKIFAEAKDRLAGRIVHWGFAETFAEYAAWLWRTDILPVTSIHDFFGAGVVQALYCNTCPLLPRRLAYPEHVPDTLHDQYFYADFDDLVCRLAERCRNIDSVRQLSTRSFVAHYDWETLVVEYDRLFEEMVEGR